VTEIVTTHTYYRAILTKSRAYLSERTAFTNNFNQFALACGASNTDRTLVDLERNSIKALLHLAKMSSKYSHCQ
jgi:hypothetical protein